MRRDSLYRLVILGQTGATRGQDDRGFFGEGGSNGGGNIGIGDDACSGAVKALASQEIYRDGAGSVLVDTRGGASRGDDDDGGALRTHSG